jgi:hypothetical protein
MGTSPKGELELARPLRLAGKSLLPPREREVSLGPDPRAAPAATRTMRRLDEIPYEKSSVRYWAVMAERRNAHNHGWLNIRE